MFSKSKNYRQEELLRQICDAATSMEIGVCDSVMIHVSALPSSLDNMFYERFGMSAEDVFDAMLMMNHNDLC